MALYHIFGRAYGVAGLATGIFGVAGWREDAHTWAAWAEMNPELAGVFVGAGGVMFATYLIWEICRFLQHRRGRRRAATGAAPTAVCYLTAGAIIDRFISPAMMDKTDPVKMIIRKDILDRFGETPGAKLGQFDYNGVLLRQWLEHNAARFLVKHRGEMQ